MNMNRITPEKVGVSSGNIRRYIEILERNRLSTHNVILARGNDMFFEKYWEPFHKDFLHRMYSVSKSFVAIAIGFLEQDGLVSLDDNISKYFANELKDQKDENLRNQTIKHMLMMSTAKTDRNWFDWKAKDRVNFYFENDTKETRPSGTIFQYDSTGSFVLGALVERLTGMPFMEYLRIKLFDKIGVSKEAYCLKCPGGHSWGDSGVICTPMDLLKVAKFVMDKGHWNGEQILSEKYLTDATSKMIDNNSLGIEEHNSQGYGYQIWKTYQNSFFFNGMGCQFAICVPDEDIIMIYNGDNQGKLFAKKIIIDNFFDLIVNSLSSVSLPANITEQKALDDYANNLKLAAAIGECHTDFEKTVNGVTYVLQPNPMGIKKFRLVFKGEQGRFEYENAQGEKSIIFGMGYNQFGLFPQEGYSDEIGSVEMPGNYYKYAASAAWIEPQKLFIKVQIIDKYFGNLNINIGFLAEKAGIYMNKSAENFLDEYVGYAGGIATII